MFFPLPAAMIEFLILGLLEEADSYGYELCQKIKTIQTIKEPVLYPILKKMMQEGLISCYEREYAGRKRKYYRLEQNGTERLRSLRQDWREYSQKITDVTRTENHSCTGGY